MIPPSCSCMTCFHIQLLVGTRLKHQASLLTDLSASEQTLTPSLKDEFWTGMLSLSFCSKVGQMDEGMNKPLFICPSICAPQALSCQLIRF